jgi:ubiquinol-cytochrome c reductase cytochrome c1 subunit
VWPTDFSKIKLRPGGINYIYNISTGYHFTPPFGMDVPKGKSFNPYFDHMIIGNINNSLSLKTTKKNTP